MSRSIKSRYVLPAIACLYLVLPFNVGASPAACIPADNGKSCMLHQCSTVCCNGYSCQNIIKHNKT